MYLGTKMFRFLLENYVCQKVIRNHYLQKFEILFSNSQINYCEIQL